MLGGLFRPLNLLIILIVLIVALGPDRLPRIGKELGQGLKELKRITSTDNMNRVRSGANLLRSVAKTVLKIYYVFFSKER